MEINRKLNREANRLSELAMSSSSSTIQIFT
jgi:hypothetical protein